MSRHLTGYIDEGSFFALHNTLSVTYSTSMYHNILQHLVLFNNYVVTYFSFINGAIVNDCVVIATLPYFTHFLFLGVNTMLSSVSDKTQGLK
jgi:hypothetical protein